MFRLPRCGKRFYVFGPTSIPDFPTEFWSTRVANSAKVFIDIAAISNVQVESTGVEAHSSLGLGERYHQPLRTTYRKIMATLPDTDREIALSCAVKSMNDTLGPEGLVPSALVFGEFPNITSKSETPTPRASALSRAAIAATAREEMSQIMERMRVRRALKHAVPQAADRSYQPGDDVLVWRERLTDNRIGEWVGPFKVLSFAPEKKIVYIQDVKIGNAKPFNVAQVKPYLAPEMVAHSFMQKMHNTFVSYGNPSDCNVYMTEILNEKDPRAHSQKMSEAKKSEIRNLQRGTFKDILREEIPEDANILPGRFVLAIKSTVDGEIKHKPRYVIGGHRDRFKNLMVHSSSTLQPQSVRLLLALAAIHGFNVWTPDIRQAYLQSAEPLVRQIFIKDTVPEFELNPGQCLQLLKPLYGLCESGDLWYKTMDDHHRKELGMQRFRFDPALYMLMCNGILRGLSGGYVDDLIRVGDISFKELAKKTHERFDMDTDKTLPCSFTGFSLKSSGDGEMEQDQHNYMRNLEHLGQDGSFSQFRSMRMKLAWLANTRPDCLFEISQLAQITEDRYLSSPREAVKRLNRAVKFAVDNRLSLRIRKLDRNSIRVIGFSDSSFANNHDLSTQLGHICFIGDKNDSVVPIHFKSYKSKRVVRSPMAGEVVAFSDLFDVAGTLASELAVVFGRKIPVHLFLFTDSKCLFDVISKGSRTAEMRMMLDIAAARQGFKDKIISDIGFVRSSQNVADGLTKSMAQAALHRIVATGKLNVNPEQWIIRN
eukprot:gb/GEZJ01000282.1/.p1 GENE.gb/GEZJ01000282.1/~~gb/GEZJ01000282.1/.p1  ORF type:complete len:768 (+),score=79.54 gb/GEZJ01000282.1/:1785-4088(+)